MIGMGILMPFLVTNRLSDKPAPVEGIEVRGRWSADALRWRRNTVRSLILILIRPNGIRVVKAGEYDLLYRNEGDRFREIGRELGIEGADEGLAAVWFDFESGWLDRSCANDFYGPDRLYRNERGKGFTEVAKEVLPHLPWFSMGVDQGDVNNDGWMDLMTSDMAGSNHYLSKLGMGDMEKDGWFLRTASPAPVHAQFTLPEYRGKAFGEVAHMAGLAGTDWTWSVKFGDLDNDGWIDLIGTNGMTQDRTNSDFLNQAQALQTAQAKRDFWRNSPPKKDENFIFRNLGGISFSKVSANGASTRPE